MPNRDVSSVHTATPVLSREHILDATETCLREKDYEAATIRRIASRLGCSVGSIYRYFKNKHDLLYEVAQRQLEDVLALAEKNVGSREGGNLVERCERLYLQRVQACPKIYCMMFWLASVEHDRNHQEGDLLPQIVGKIIEGWSRSLGSRVAAKTRWAALHGRIMLGDRSTAGPNKAFVVSQLPPLPAPIQSDHAPPRREQTVVTLGDEDVCLL